MARFLVLLVLVGGALATGTHGASPRPSVDEGQLPFADEPAHAAFLQEFKATHPARQSKRQASGLAHGLHDRAMLFFRSLDADHDKHITRRDAAASVDKLNRFVPGIREDEFESFIEAADGDGDGALNMNEFVAAFARGLDGQQASAPMLLETSAGVRAALRSARVAHRRVMRVGFIGDAVSAVGNWIGNKAGQLGRHLSGKLDTSQDSCVLCQYILQRCEGNVQQSGVIPSMSSQQAAASFVETDASVQSTAHQDSFDMSGASTIAATHQGTRYQRLMERQKYNEIYRVVDITLDDVCEQGMPNNFYGYCKVIYQTQSDVVDGLRYQYRPSDICFRIGMCDKKSYIAQGVHSRYKSGG